MQVFVFPCPDIACSCKSLSLSYKQCNLLPIYCKNMLHHREIILLGNRRGLAMGKTSKCKKSATVNFVKLIVERKKKEVKIK